MGKEVIVLLDNRAMHNFISDSLVKELRILIWVAKFVVVLGNDRKVEGLGKCEGFAVAF